MFIFIPSVNEMSLLLQHSASVAHPQECFLCLRFMFMSGGLHTLPHSLAQQTLLFNLSQILICLLTLFLQMYSNTKAIRYNIPAIISTYRIVHPKIGKKYYDSQWLPATVKLLTNSYRFGTT